MSATESRNRTEPEPLELGLLGPLRLRRGGVALPPPRTAKGRALLALLAGAERALPREHLMALLWESAPPEKASGSLRVALSDLGGPWVIDSKPIGATCGSERGPAIGSTCACWSTGKPAGSRIRPPWPKPWPSKVSCSRAWSSRARPSSTPG